MIELLRCLERFPAGLSFRLKLKRLWRENADLKHGRDIPKGCGLQRETGKSMTFGFIKAAQASLRISRIFRASWVRQSGLFAWLDRPARFRRHSFRHCPILGG